MPATEKEYILLCDESVKEGVFYSNFYGGVLVGASCFESVSARLNARKTQLHFHGEVKWQKVTENYLAKYKSLMDGFFDELEQARVRVRIMFRQNARKPSGLTPQQQEQTFYILYYQFIKHAFGFQYMPPRDEEARLRVYFDQFPDTGEQVTRFRGYILGLNSSKEFRKPNLRIHEEDLTEIDSRDHVLLQCLDVVLGAMAFRLNDMHKQKLPGKNRRGARTRAKEELFNHILCRIRHFHPHFNIGISTGSKAGGYWDAPYRHWCFVPSEHEYDSKMTKRGK